MSRKAYQTHIVGGNPPEDYQAMTHSYIEYVMGRFLTQLEEYEPRLKQEALEYLHDDLDYDGYRSFQLSEFTDLVNRHDQLKQNEAIKHFAEPESLTNAAKSWKRQFIEQSNQGEPPVSPFDPLIREDLGDLRQERHLSSPGSTFVHDRNVGESFIVKGSFEQEITAPSEPQGRQVTSAEVKKPTSEPKRQQSRQQDDSIVHLQGWQGDDETDGLGDYIGSYFSPKDQQTLQAFYDQTSFDVSAFSLDQSVNLLQYMRNRGLDFSPVFNDAHKESLNVNLDEHPYRVRAFDGDNPRYTGRLYDGYNAYYMNSTTANKADQLDWSDEDTTLPLQVMLGEVKGDFVKTTSSKNAQVKGISSDKEKLLQVMPEVSHFDAIHFDGKEDAKAYIQGLIDSGNEAFDQLVNVDGLEAVHRGEADDQDVLSMSEDVEGIQKAILSDTAQFDAVMSGELDSSLAQFRYLNEESLDQASDVDADDRLKQVVDLARQEHVGDLENGYNPSFLINHAPQDHTHLRTRESLLSATLQAGVDTDTLKGGDYNIDRFKEQAVQFDPSTARTLHDLDDDDYLKEKLTTIQDSLSSKGVIGSLEAKEDENKPPVAIDDQGVVKWQGYRQASRSKKGVTQNVDGKPYESEAISGQIGQLFEPDERGVHQVRYNSGEELGFVPGYAGYYRFGEDPDSPITDRLRLKGFDQQLDESIERVLSSQVIRAKKMSWDDIPQGLDASALNSLYHGDVYGKRVDADYADSMGEDLSEEDLNLRIDTLKGKVRFSNQYAIYASTQAETRMNDPYWGNRASDGEKAYWNAVGRQNVRVIDDDKVNIFDLDMTGNGQTQGLALYLVDGAEVNEDGSVTPADDYINDQGQAEPNRAPMMKSDYFKFKDYDSWIRRQMPANEFLTAKRIDPDVKTASALLEGWTMEDGYPVSKEFAERNAITTEEKQKDGTSETIRRSLQRGDKISDFHGNKGVITLVVDRDMPLEEAKEQDIENVVKVFKENPELDVMETSESGISRHNAGRYREQLADSNRLDLKDKDGQVVAKNSVASKAFMVTDKDVDSKTNAYSEFDFAEGKGAKASGQFTWQANVAEADEMMKEIFDPNTRNWAVYREYLIAYGLDMDEDGQLSAEGYQPHEGEVRRIFDTDDYDNSDDFLNDVSDKGGFLQVPPELKTTLKSGHQTTKIPVLSASLRQDTTLVDGQVKQSQYNQYYSQMFDAIQDYKSNEKDVDEARTLVNGAYNRLADDIDQRYLSGKRGYLRSRLMGRRLDQSASGVLIADPRRKVGEYGMDSDMRESLNVEEGDSILAMRNPIWTKGGLRSGEVVNDESVHGLSANPIAVKSMDGDFDGDKLQAIRFKNPKTIREVDDVFGHRDNLLNPGASEPELYYHAGSSELKAAELRAEKEGDSSLTKLKDQALTFGQSDNQRVRQKGLDALNDYTAKAFRQYGDLNYPISLESEEEHLKSIGRLIDDGVKGSVSSYDNYKMYFNGEKTRQHDLDMQYATGVKTDDTGLAGAVSQRLVAMGRNSGDMEAITYATYPVTQGTIGIKHSAGQARTVNDVLTSDLRSLYDGSHPKTGKSVRTESWARMMKDVYDKKLGVDYNPKHIDQISELVSVGGVAKSKEELMAKKASPMDQVAYADGSGGEKLTHLAKKGRNFFEGEQSRKYVPSRLLRQGRNLMKDTQDEVVQDRLQAQVEQEDRLQRERNQSAPQANVSQPAPQAESVDLEP